MIKMFMSAFSLVVVVIGVKFLKWLEHAKKPKVYHSDSTFIKEVLARCRQLMIAYKPPLLWGKSGHIQTALYGKIGRWNCPSPAGQRHMVTMDTGETMSYDVFEPSNEISFTKSRTILVCPGICNSSEKKYIRTFVKFCMDCGYRLYVLNHIGVLPNVKLTSPKIFTYGDTRYFARMTDEALLQHPDSLFVIVGFSMGGNIITKYLGEDVSRQQPIECAISLCQGYDGLRSILPLTRGYKRFYNYMITKNFLKVLEPHWDDIFRCDGDHAHAHTSRTFDEGRVRRATCLRDIEDGLLRHIDGHPSAQDYIRQCGCQKVIQNIRLPIMLLNSEDDPLIECDVHDIPMRFSKNNDNALFVTTRHGGHLGFFKGSWYRPDDITMLEIYVIEFIEAVLEIKQMGPPTPP